MKQMNKLLGISLLLIVIMNLGRTFIPVIQQEINYNVTRVDTFTKSTLKSTTPVDMDFGIIIDKIGANAHVIKNVNPYDENVYQKALVGGISHVDGSAIPGQKGHIFLFSHSSENLFKASKYNSVFYLLSKLEKGDEIRLYYENNTYVYLVQEKKIVPRSTVEFISDNTTEESLTLMTTWPPGTSVMRVLILVTRQQS